MLTVPTYRVVVRNMRTREQIVIALAILDRATALATFEAFLEADRRTLKAFHPHGVWRALVLPGKELRVPNSPRHAATPAFAVRWPSGLAS